MIVCAQIMPAHLVKGSCPTGSRVLFLQVPTLPRSQLPVSCIDAIVACGAMANAHGRFSAERILLVLFWRVDEVCDTKAWWEICRPGCDRARDRLQVTGQLDVRFIRVLRDRMRQI